MTEQPILITGQCLRQIHLSENGNAGSNHGTEYLYGIGKDFEGRAFRVFSSMALQDDLLSGEKYYIAETRSLKRILDTAKENNAILCVVDEVLHGTNTVERIAASSEVLQAMANSGLLCLAAIRDLELCDLLRGSYGLYHFEEQAGENETLFDYVIREGKATSRNAINILQLIGFDQQFIDNVHEKASRYLKTGVW